MSDKDVSAIDARHGKSMESDLGMVMTRVGCPCDP